MQKKSENKIDELHEVSWKGLWSIFRSRGTFSKWPFICALLVTIALALVLLFYKSSESYDILQNTCELILSFFPNLLGFTLGGFAIIVGFSNTELIKEGTSLEEHSTYQILNAIFSYSILVQVSITLISFFVSWSIKNNLSDTFEIRSEIVFAIINFILLFIVIFGSIFTLFITPLIIINLFTFSQVNNYFYTLKEQDRLKREAIEELQRAEKNKPK